MGLMETGAITLEVLTAKLKAIKWHEYTEAKNMAKIEARFGLSFLVTPKQLFCLRVLMVLFVDL